MKILNKILSISFFIAIMLIINACAVKEKVNHGETTAKFLPENYDQNSKTDTNSIAKVNWKEFYNDSVLVNLIEEGLNNNYDINIMLERIGIGEEEYNFQRRELLPNLNFNPNAAQRRWGLYTMDGAGNISTFIRDDEIVPVNLRDYMLTIQSSWEVDVWGKLNDMKKSKYMSYFSTIEGLNLLKTSLISQIAFLYYELIALDKKLDILSQTIQNQENALNIVIAQKEAGQANLLAVKQLNSQLLRTKGLKIEIEQRINITENELNFIIGRPYQKIIRLTEFDNNIFNYELESGIPSQLLENRPDIRQAKLDFISSNFRVKSTKKAFYPSININSFIGYQAYKTNLLFLTPESIAYSFFVGLTAPLLNRNKIKAEHNIAKRQKNENELLYYKTILNAFTEINTNLKDIEFTNEKINLKLEENKVAQESIKIATELFKTGKASYIEVLMSQNNSLNANLELIMTQRQLNQLKIKTYKLLGGGWQ